MAGLLYYKTGKRTNNQVTLDDAKKWGLGYAFETAPNSIDVGGGKTPGGGKGFVFADDGRLNGRTLGFYPDEQRWQQLPCRDADDPVWVGCYTAAMPTPDDLAYDQQMGGYPITLQDGGKYNVPLARRFDEGAKDNLVSRLPVKLSVDLNGKVCDGEVIEAYKYLWEVTDKYAQSRMNFINPLEGETEIDESDLLQDAVLILSANYRIQLGEAILLEWFGRNVRDLPLAVCLLSIDYPQLVNWAEDQKKTDSQVDSDTPSIAAGNSA